MSPELVESLTAKLRAHESRQLGILERRPNPSAPRSEPGEDSVRVDGALRMRERGCLLFPPLPLSEVEAFEVNHGVALPSDYRDFLIQVGDGGEGPPFYGLLQFGELREGWSSDEQFSNLRKPFPFVTPWVWDDEVDWSPEKVALKKAAADLHGCLVLGTDGCGIDWVLVVTGAERGQIWQLCEQGVQPLAPRRTFLSWYQHWLDGHDDWWADLGQPGR